MTVRPANDMYEKIVVFPRGSTMFSTPRAEELIVVRAPSGVMIVIAFEP
ncbi:MAG: hypothetical protein HYX53_16950 [Chloroflexi bacterium]|jgi:hypothetical protein|nr:hypothetical protein [Chloroflexota bacterium]